MDQGQTGRAAQADFDAADAGTRAALVNHAHGKALIEDQDRLEGIPERAAEMNAAINAEAQVLRQITAADRARIQAHHAARRKEHDHRYTIQNPQAGFEAHAVCEVCGFSLPEERAAVVRAEQAARVHPFQAAGLGLAPFRFVGMEHRTYQAAPDAPVQPGGSCDYCGTGISYFCWILSADGRRFKVGSDCIRKTDMALYREAKDAEKAERAADRRAARARDLAEEEARQRVSRTERALSFMRLHKGLEDALTSGLDHPILKDMHARLIQFGSLSPAQISFALRLADEVRNPAPAEVHVPAPEGRVTFRGTVVSLKEVEDRYSFRNYRGEVPTILKMIVKVQADGGVWMAWMTVPSSEGRPERGTEMTITATLSRGRDAHFAFGKRPVVWTPEAIQKEQDKAARKAARAAKKEKTNA